MPASVRQIACFVLLFAVLPCAGCGAPGSHVADLFRWDRKPDSQELEKHRKQYQSTRDKQAMRWLLGNALQPGMTRSEVESVLGEEGVRETNDRWLKTNGDAYRLDDIIYCYGPDDEGHCVYLGFREDRLINFDPEEFEELASGKRKRGKRAESDDEDES